MRKVLAALALSTFAVQPLAASDDTRELDRTYLRLFLQSQAINHWSDCMVQRKLDLARSLFDPVTTVEQAPWRNA